MDRSLYIAMSGAKQILVAQRVNTNNLANSNTPGFKADLAALTSVPVQGEGFPSRVYAAESPLGMNLASGTVLTTARSLDVAINGPGWIAVQAGDGNEAYTRGGNLKFSPSGILETSSGAPVMGNGGPISVPPFEKLEIGADGTISIQPIGQEASALAVVDRIRMVQIPENEIFKAEDGLVRHKGESAIEPGASISLVSGALESSNVNAVEVMVNMISLARQFELQVKVMKTTDDNEAASASMMRIS